MVEMLCYYQVLTTMQNIYHSLYFGFIGTSKGEIWKDWLCWQNCDGTGYHHCNRISAFCTPWDWDWWCVSCFKFKSWNFLIGCCVQRSFELKPFFYFKFCLGKTVFTSDHALKLEWIPDWIAIVGSGYIGLEFSDVYTALGSEVKLFSSSIFIRQCF